jgi:RNA polymerase sigma-70 factor, ECF subfamily
VDAHDQSAEARFRRLHEEHFEAVRRYAWRRDATTADDVASDTFVVAWRRLAEVPDDARPWLIGVARNVRLNVRRSQRRQEQLTRELSFAHPVTEVAHDAADAELSPQIAAALGSLAPLDREILLLHAWDELERDEIAVALGCSKANVSVRLHRAKHRFERALANARDRSSMSTSEGAVDGC